MFDEFRVVVQPDAQNTDQWSIDVRKAPRAQFVGAQASTTPAVNQADLALLRNGAVPPTIAGLRALGKAVLNSIMPAATQAGLQVCIEDAQKQGRGLRIVVSVIGTRRQGNGSIGCNELPVEALFTDTLNFLATNRATPISRGINVVPDREAVKVAPPLRILVVASEPTDMPPVSAAAEIAALRASLQRLIDAQAVQLDFCTPPTASRLDAVLQQQRYHIVHFIGHGDFEVSGLDPDPQPHLYFERDGAGRQRHAVDAEQLFTMLRNGNVPMIVMTACSTAATSPNGAQYPALAFEGLAQTLVERNSGPLAAVGMQFDLETDAAATFSGALYQHLLSPGITVDSAVAVARSALVAKFGAAHRAWVNPTVCWRCVDGMVFNLLDTGGELTPEQQAQLAWIDGVVADYEGHLKMLAEQPPDVVAAMAPMRAQWQAKIDGLMHSRGEILGETVRLRGGKIGAAGTVQCTLALQLRSGAKIGDVKVTIDHEGAGFDLVSSVAGSSVPANSLLVQSQPGQPAIVLVSNASGGNQWNAGEQELAKLTFKPRDPGTRPMFRIRLSATSVVKNGAADPSVRALDAIVFKDP